MKVLIIKSKDLGLFPLISYYFEYLHYREIIVCKSKSEKIISLNFLKTVSGLSQEPILQPFLVSDPMSKACWMVYPWSDKG